MQDTGVKSIGTQLGTRQSGWMATHQNRAKRQVGHVASCLVSSAPVAGLVVVGIVSIFLLRGSG